MHKTNPDLIMLNNNMTNNNTTKNITLTRKTLKQNNCKLIPLTSTINTNNTPTPTTNSTPCYYIPNNHKSYQTTNQNNLTPFQTEFSQPYGTFNHNNTRFILLANSY